MCVGMPVCVLDEMTFDLDTKGVPKGVLPVNTGSVYRAIACWLSLTLSGQCLSDQCRRLHTVVGEKNRRKKYFRPFLHVGRRQKGKVG